MKKRTKLTWFISDLHFDHKNVIEFSDRPFSSIEEMNDKIINNIKKVVSPGDTLIIVGDFSLGAKKENLKNYIKRIKESGCYLINVRGNHDESNSIMMNHGFDLACDKLEITLANEKVTVMHYPYRQSLFMYYYYKVLNKIFPTKFWNERRYWDKLPFKKKYLIHGHTHSTILQNEYQFNVSCEALNYTPIQSMVLADKIAKHREKEKKKSFWEKFLNKKKIYIDHKPREKGTYK